MKKRYFLLLLFFPILFHAQSNNKIEPDLEKQIDICEFTKKNNNYKQLIIKASQGIKSSMDNDYYAARFYFYKAYGYEYDNNKYAQAIPYFEKSWEYAKKGKNLKEETQAIMRLNYLYYSTKQFKKRNNLINYIKVILDTTTNIYTQGILNGSLGEYYLDNLEIEKFIGYKLQAIEYRKKFPKDEPNNLVNIGISYSQIGQAYIKMNQFKKGIEYCNLAKPYMKGSKNALAFLYNDYIKCFVALKNIDSVKKYYAQINKLVTKEDSLYISRSSANRFTAEYYIQNNQNTTASTFAEKALFYGKKSNDEVALMEANLSKGKILYQQKKYQEAIKILKIAGVNAYEFDKKSFVTIHKLLSDSYFKLENWKEAYQNHEIYANANEIILEELAKQSIADAEAQYQNKYKQERINFLSAENKIKNIEIENTRRKQIYFIVGTLLLLLFSTLLYEQNFVRRKANYKLKILNTELDKANKIKAKFFSILNHDLRSPVYNLIHFLHLQKENPELLTTESKERIEAKTLSSVENLLISMEDMLLWSKGQMENFKPQPKRIYISSIFNDVKNHFESEEKVQIVFDNPENIQVNTDEDYLKTIIRNLTGNAIKALIDVENPSIIWKATQQNNQCFLTIQDNGKGATREQFKALYDEKEVVGIQSGLGLHLIRDLAKAINCDISVNSSTTLGTTITLQFLS